MKQGVYIKKQRVTLRVSRNRVEMFRDHATGSKYTSMKSEDYREDVKG
jgi:hypothetical protein